MMNEKGTMFPTLWRSQNKELHPPPPNPAPESLVYTN